MVSSNSEELKVLSIHFLYILQKMCVLGEFIILPRPQLKQMWFPIAIIGAINNTEIQTWNERGINML